MDYTKEQEQAIYTRDQDILVSAGAGAGKTRVLVTRISEMILDPNHPVSAEAFLVLTFTRAAAREMKERITKELERRLEEDPENRELRRQIRIVKHADISTIHSFCNHLIRTHFNELGIDPSYRIGEEGELKILKQDTVDELLEECYTEGKESFVNFVEAYAPGKEDKNLGQMILDLYEFSRSFPNAKAWFQNIEDQFAGMLTEEGLEQSGAIQIIMGQAKNSITLLRNKVNQAKKCFEKEPGPDSYYKMILADEKKIQSLEEAKSFMELHDALHGIRFDRMPNLKKAEKDWPYVEEIKHLHNDIKNIIEETASKHFLKSISQVRIEQRKLFPLFQEYISLGQRFQKQYAFKKKEKNIYDYDDLEQLTLKLLVDSYDEDGNVIPSKYAKEIAGKYQAIFVDEYQDTNLVQETIINTLLASGSAELFVVGDVKQSIYRFRQARPDLFLNRYNKYVAGEGLKIELRDNFRSSIDVLDFCNRFFSRWMKQDFGGIEYDDAVALKAGENGPMREVRESQEALLWRKPKEDDSLGYEPVFLESVMIAERILRLKEEGYDYKDMVILLRSVKGYAEIIASALEERGIPVLCESQTGYFQNREIRIILNYLSVIDNVYQDIPMASALLSGIGDLTPGELAELKILVDPSMRKKLSLYELMNLYLTEGKNEKCKAKIAHFLNLLQEFRQRKEEILLHELLWEIYQKTGFYDEVLAMPNGQKCQENLMMLIHKSMEYEKTSFKGLFYFIRYMEQMRTYEIEPGGGSITESEENVVKIMTIHKSKGLEYPVVFVSVLSKGFNMMDLTNSVLFHPELGIGMDLVDSKDRVRSSTILKMAIREQVRKELLEEELRILYVAMTRAQKKLILTGILEEKKVEELEKADVSLLRAQDAGCLLDWVLPVLYQDGKWEHCQIYDTEDLLTCLEKEKEEKESITLEEMLQDIRVSREDPDLVHRSFSREYPYLEAVGWKRKLSVSELKKLAMMELPNDDSRFANELAEKNDDTIPKPEFMKEEQEEISGMVYGTMIHKIMELLPFGKITNRKELFEEMQPLFDLYPEISLSQRKKAYYGAEQFLFCEEGEVIRAADKENKVFKELPFTIGLDASNIYKDTQQDEFVVIQGIVDLCLEVEDGLWLVDYKTDRIGEGEEFILLDRYKTQMLYYKIALEQMLQKKVTNTMFYSFALKKYIPIEWES